MDIPDDTNGNSNPVGRLQASVLEMMSIDVEIDGRDLRQAGLCSTAISGFHVLYEMESNGMCIRGSRGWRLPSQ